MKKSFTEFLVPRQVVSQVLAGLVLDAVSVDVLLVKLVAEPGVGVLENLHLVYDLARLEIMNIVLVFELAVSHQLGHDPHLIISVV